jgi:hypothetical protein
MDILFKPEVVPSGETFVKHTNFKDVCPVVHSNTSWENLVPYIKKATRTFILPWIGRDLYDDLAAKYQADTALTDDQAEVMLLLQEAISHYAIYMALPLMNVQLTNLGVQQSNDREGTSAPPSQWAFKNARWEVLTQADQSLDNTLKQLTYEVSQGNAYYDLWVDHEAYNFGTSNFIRTNEELSTFLNYQQSLRAYKEVIRYVKLAEDRHVYPVLGKEMYNELKSEVLAGTLTTENQALLEKVQPMAANFGLFEAIPYLTLVQDGDGFRVVSRSDVMDSRRNLTNVTHQRAIESLRQAAEQNGNSYRADLQAFLYSNADDYPTFKNSSVYDSYDSTTTSYESIDGKGAVFL